MMKRSQFLHSVADALALDPIPLSTVPLIEIYDNKRILIENHCGIMGYDDREILIKLRKGYIRILGAELWLRRMNRSSLIIQGCIDAVNFTGDSENA